MTFLEIWAFIKTEILPALVTLAITLSPLIIAVLNAKGRKKSLQILDLKQDMLDVSKGFLGNSQKLSNMVDVKEFKELVNTVNTVKDIMVTGYSNSTLPEEIKSQIRTKDLENKLGGGAEVVQGLIKKVEELEEKASAKAVEAIKTTSEKVDNLVKKSTRIRG